MTPVPTNVCHHIPDDILQAYVTGSLPHVFSVVVASHVSLCDDCRAVVEAQEALGGAVLDGCEAEAADQNLKACTLALLDRPIRVAAPEARRSGIFPGPIMAELKGRPPKWKMLGGGIRQTILAAGAEGSVRLLYIPGGKAVPDHGHNGLELTLVLQGAFHDETGTFGPGDVQVASDDLDHAPIANMGEPCVCLAATDAPLRFRSLVPRLLQPIFRI